MAADARDAELVAFAAGRGTPLFRLAFLVQGEQGPAEDALVDALARVRLAWGRTADAGSAEEEVRRLLVTAPPRGQVRPVPATAPDIDTDIETSTDTDPTPDSTPDSTPQAGADPDGEPDAQPDAQPDEEEVDRAHIWAAFRSLSFGERAALVLAALEGLDDEEAARLLGRSLRATQTDLSHGLAALRSVADPPGRRHRRPLNERLRATLDDQARSVTAPNDLGDRALSRADELGSARRRRGLTWGAAAAVVVGLLAGFLVLGPTGGQPPDAFGSPAPSSSSDPSGLMTDVPDEVLNFAREQSALLGYGSVVVDGGVTPLVLAAVVDPATGASQGARVEAVARAEGGYVALTRPAEDEPAQGLWTLSYLPRTGTSVQLGQVGVATSGFAVSADGLSVVHVVPGPQDGPDPLRADQSELVVQTLGGDVVNRLQVEGPVMPWAMDEDHIWFSRALDPTGAPYVWSRRTADIHRLRTATGWLAMAVQGDLVLLRHEGSRGCFEMVDGFDPEAPRLLWRHCGLRPPAAISPAGDLVAVQAQGSGPDLRVLDAQTGRTLGQASVESGGIGRMGWTDNGQKLLLEAEDDLGRSTVVAVTPPSRSVPVIGDLLSYPLRDVVLGVAGQLPSVG